MRLECPGRLPHHRKGRLQARSGVSLAGLLGLLHLCSAQSQDTSSCTWLPWHPPVQPAISNGSLATVISTPPRLCPDGAVITDLYVNKTETPNGVPSLRFLTAKCSEGTYLGYYARAYRPPSEPLSTQVAHEDGGLSGMTGEQDTCLEGLGSLNGPSSCSDGTPMEEFRDLCPENATVSGYQFTSSSGGGVLQLRFLCIESGVNSSNCSAVFSQPASAPGPGAPDSGSPLSPTLRLSNSSTEQVYISFALQWGRGGKPDPNLVVASLMAMDPYLLASLHSTGSLCLSDEQSTAASRGSNASCFEVGPVHTDTSVPLLQSVQNWVASSQFQSNLTARGVQTSPPALILASLSEVSIEDEAAAGSMAPSAAPSQGAGLPAASSGTSHSDTARNAGLIAGFTLLGTLVLVASILLLVSSRRRLGRGSAAAQGKDCEKHLDGVPKEGPWLQPPSPGSAVKACRSVFEEGGPTQDQNPLHSWAVRGSWEWTWREGVEGEPAQLMAERSQRLRSEGSTPGGVSKGRSKSLSQNPWAIEPPTYKQIISPFSYGRPPRTGGWKTGLAQDSDEAMKSSLCPNQWQLMHSQVTPPQTREVGLPGDGDDAVSPNPWTVDSVDALSRSSSQLVRMYDTSRLKSAPTEASLPISGLPSSQISGLPDGQETGFDRELRATLLAATCTTTNTSTSGEDTSDKWEIQPADLTICHHPNGQPVQLGVGAFGTVYKALLHDVTEVAAKQLHASSESQIALFKREISIHKQCRSSHVVQFLGACIEPTCMTLVTELMDHSLDKDIYDLSRPFEWEDQCKNIASDVAQALAYLHHQRVVHLDIKSRNVLLTIDGHAKIADVGLSQVLQNTYLSQLDGLGTFAYAAPELLSGGSNCSTKADIWSYGVLLHEMVTREIPQRGALCDRPPHRCPPHVHSLISQCMARDPAERPSAKTVVKFLRADTPEQAEAILAASALEDGLPSRRSSYKTPDRRKLIRWSSMP